MGNVQLQIDSNRGLSHAIDKALDAELQQNVTITDINVWKSIFNIITENEQAEQTQKDQKQFDKEKIRI